MTGYWPWWDGALALGAIAALHARSLRKPLGVSGSVRRVVDAATDPLVRRAEQADLENADLEAAMLAATERQFGAVARDESPSDTSATALPTESTMPREAPWTAHMAFLVAVVTGAALATMMTTGFAPRVAPSSVYQHLIARGVPSYLTLALGGLCVGFGTRMSGGCTSGHGLNGCSQLFPASLAATCAFFGTGVLLSFALEVMAR
jgi:uncharacterized membrane protein YedE/YeeE